MTQKEINEIQKHINSTSGIIIYFTEHLLERVNHTRNSPSIERDELVDTIEKAFKFHGKKTKNLEHLKEFYVKNVDTNLNLQI